MNKTGFSKTKRPGFTPPYLLFVICLWTCLLTWAQTTHESTRVNFSAQYGPRIQFRKVGRNFTSFCLGLHKISEKFSRNRFFLKYHVRISTEFGRKREKFQVKRTSIRARKRSNSSTHKRTFLSAPAVMNKKFIANLVGRIWGSNLSQNSIDRVTNSC